ncbi:hypothetical protein HYT32_00055 [Candidatus Roizmanbacteria bacterium]|nr:hypothetical protein [Candidatus Roizmanbacteria bacterium]
MIYFDIITSLKTLQDRDRLSSDIEDLLTSIFKMSGQPFDNLLKTIRIDFAEKIKDAFRKSGLDSQDKEQIRNFLTTLKHLLGRFRIIKITLAFDPSNQTIENIHSWISSRLGQGYILDIQTSPEVLGGAIIVFNGEYRDFTIKKNIEAIFTSRKEQVLNPAY